MLRAACPAGSQTLGQTVSNVFGLGEWAIVPTVCRFAFQTSLAHKESISNLEQRTAQVSPWWRVARTTRWTAPKRALLLYQRPCRRTNSSTSGFARGPETVAMFILCACARCIGKARICAAMRLCRTACAVGTSCRSRWLPWPTRQRADRSGSCGDVVHTVTKMGSSSSWRTLRTVRLAKANHVAGSVG